VWPLSLADAHAPLDLATALIFLREAIEGENSTRSPLFPTLLAEIVHECPTPGWLQTGGCFA
jgi:hypothetical protein